jgi:hypothetical protein
MLHPGLASIALIAFLDLGLFVAWRHGAVALA